MLFKILILVIMGLILLSLGAGVFFLKEDSDKSTRLVRSLTVRVGLSFLLLALLLIGYFTGQLSPHGLQ